MKNIEDQYKSIKNDYNQKISTFTKNKIEKYFNILRQMNKLQLIKTNEQKNNDDRIGSYNKNQIFKLRRQIQSQFKMQMTDYQAYLWKLQKIYKIEKPIFFQNVQVSLQNLTQFNLQKIKKNFNFPIFSIKIKDLIRIGADLLLQNKFCSQSFNVQIPFKLLTMISTNYNIQPYHNFTHGFSVFMMLIQCKNTCQSLAKSYSQFQFFVTLVAALCHDLNHNGTNSSYEIKKKSELSILYNNQSVLENMHIATFYKMCKQNNEIDVIGKIKSPIQRQAAKRLFSKLILATDIQGHLKNLQKLEILNKQKKPMSQLQTLQKQLILENLFHACDIGNPCLQFQIYINWSLLLAQQFTNQVKLQKQQNLEISTNMEYIDLATHYRRQIGFIDYLVLPIWKQITTIFENLNQLKDQIQNNKQKLQKTLTKTN